MRLASSRAADPLEDGRFDAGGGSAAFLVPAFAMVVVALALKVEAGSSLRHILLMASIALAAAGILLTPDNRRRARSGRIMGVGK